MAVRIFHSANAFVAPLHRLPISTAPTKDRAGVARTAAVAASALADVPIPTVSALGAMSAVGLLKVQSSLAERRDAITAVFEEKRNLLLAQMEQLQAEHEGKQRALAEAAEVIAAQLKCRQEELAGGINALFVPVSTPYVPLPVDGLSAAQANTTSQANRLLRRLYLRDFLSAHGQNNTIQVATKEQADELYRTIGNFARNVYEGKINIKVIGFADERNKDVNEAVKATLHFGDAVFIPGPSKDVATLALSWRMLDRLCFIGAKGEIINAKGHAIVAGEGPFRKTDASEKFILLMIKAMQAANDWVLPA